MITPTQILNKYRSLEQYLEPVRRRVRDSITVLCDQEGFASVSRVKTLASVSEKVETGRFRNWDGINDLVAFTIIVPTLADEPVALRYLSETFETVDFKPRGGSLKSPETFRFDSTRFIGRLGVPEEADRGFIHDVPFEIQIKSAFEHAWAVTTHALAYKSPDVSWSKRRLTAQLKAAVEQLDTLVLSFNDSAKYIQSSDWPEIKAKGDLRNFFSEALASNLIPEELAPYDWSRFVDNIYRVVESGANRPRPDHISRSIRTAFNDEIKLFPRDAFPRSISLWQFVFACLCKSGHISNPLRDHWPLITPELEDLYPALKTFGPRFDYL